MAYKNFQLMDQEELEYFSETHPEIWGNSHMLYHPDNALVVPLGCGQCPFCDGEATYNCQCLTFEVRW